MDLIRIKNKQEYIKLIKFLYNRKNFGCVEDWDYFFELDIFSSYKDEEYKEYLKRLEGLEGKTNDQIVKEFNNLKASGIPEENMFPCIAIFDFHHNADRNGKIEVKIFEMFPENKSRTVDQFIGEPPRSKDRRNGRKRNTAPKRPAQSR